jgi:hypothetical protein
MAASGRSQRVWFLAAAAAFAAVAAHVFVDLAGDYLLVHDDYDDVAHHSRLLVLGLVAGIAVVAMLRVFGEMLESTARNPRTLLYRLRESLGSQVLFSAHTAALTIGAMGAMEALDCALSRSDGSWTALFGGSILLGGGSAAVVGAVFGWFAFRFISWLADREPHIAALVVAAFRMQIDGAPSLTTCPAASAPPPPLRRLLLLRSGRKRGPPLRTPG